MGYGGWQNDGGRRNGGGDRKTVVSNGNLLKGLVAGTLAVGAMEAMEAMTLGTVETFARMNKFSA